MQNSAAVAPLTAVIVHTRLALTHRTLREHPSHSIFIMKAFNTRNLHIGIDTTDSTLRIVGVQSGSVIFETTNIQASDQLARLCKEGLLCTASPQFGTVLTVPLETPKLPPNKLAKVLPSILDILIPIPLETCTYSFSQSGSKTIGYAIRQSDLRSTLDALSEKNCNPAHIIPSAVAAWNCMCNEFPPISADEPRALLIANARQTFLLAGHGANLEKQSLFLTTAEESIRRIKLAFVGLPANLICFLAGSAHASLATAFTSESLPTPINHKLVKNPEFFLARALAASGKPATSAVGSTNLRTGAFEHIGSQVKSKHPLTRLAVVLLISAATLVTSSMVQLTRVTRAEQQSSSTLKQALFEVSGYTIKTKGKHAVQEARQALENPSHLDQAILNQIENRLPSNLEWITRECAAKRITIQHLTLDEKGLALSGIAPSKADAEQFVQLLVARGVKTTLSEPPKSTENNTVSFFTIPSLQP